MTATLPSETDAILLRAWADAKSASAFRAIVERHGPMVRAVALRSLNGDHAIADDVAQAVFLLLAERAGRLRIDGSLAPWLHVTTRYAAANARRTLSRRARHERAAAAQRTEVAMHDARADERLRVDDDGLDDAISRLRAADRLLILERFVQGTDVATLATRLGATPATTQRRLSRAIERLRSLLARRDAPLAAALPASLATLRPESFAPDIIDAITHSATGGDASASVAAIASATRFTMLQRSVLSVVRNVSVAACVAALAFGAWRVAQAQQTPPSAVVPGPLPSAVAVTADALVGDWRFIAARANGRDAPADQLDLPSVEITTNEIVVATPGRSVERLTFVVRPAAPHAEIDYHDDDRPTRVVPGIIRLVGDELTLAFDDQNLRRPTSFERPGRAKVWVLRRSTPATQPAR